MLLKEKYSRDCLTNYIDNFINIYEDVLDEYDIEFLREQCDLGIDFDVVPFMLNQFYNEYGLIDNNRNIYLAILKKLKEVFELKNKQILEVGGGPIPILGRLIADETKNITVFDSNITHKNNDKKNLKIVSKYFTPITSLDNYDIVVSFMACGAQESIICNCANNNKDFFIGLCPCGKEAISNLYGRILSNDEYINKLVELANKKINNSDLGVLVIDRLDNRYGYDYPILYNKRIKRMSYKKDA